MIAELYQSVQTAKKTLEEGGTTPDIYLRDDERFYKPQYKGHLTWCGKMHTLFSSVERKARYGVMTALLGRQISSTKDLKFSEAVVLWNLSKKIQKYLESLNE